jgi:primosomal protein N' (replication factor Y)
VVAAATHDYASFYERELTFRQHQGDPPFSRLARLIYTHTNADLCQKEAERLYHVLEQERDSQGLANTVLFGPFPTFAQRVRGRFRWQIVIRSPDPLPLLSQVTIPRSWSIDIDPMSLV